MKIIDIYPDELFYSYIARWRVRMNHMSYGDFSRYMYVNPQVRPECLFTNTLRPKIYEEITSVIPWKEIIDRHTMIPEYRFFPIDKLKKGYGKLVESGTRDYRYLADKHIEDRMLKYCPVCAKEERELYGEAYWHRLHQIREMKVCPKHHCYLHESGVTLSRHCVANIYPAELEIPDKPEVMYCGNEKEIELTDYYKEAFEAPLIMDGIVSVGKYLGIRLPDKYRYKLSKKYGYKKSGAKDITAVYEDFSIFLSERENRAIDDYVLQKVYTDHVFPFSTICSLALFEGIPADELVNPENWEEELPFRKIYLKTAEELGIDYQTVQTIGDRVLQEYINEGRVRVKSGQKEMEWDKFDREMLPKVKEACERIYGEGDERPQKVTLGSIYKEFELPQRRLDKMPLCKEEILRWKESPMEYWAREVVWAYKQAELSPGGATKTKIQNLTNTKNRDYERYKPFLGKYTDIDTLKKITDTMER